MTWRNGIYEATITAVQDVVMLWQMFKNWQSGTVIWAEKSGKTTRSSKKIIQLTRCHLCLLTRHGVKWFLKFPAPPSETSLENVERFRDCKKSAYSSRKRKCGRQQLAKTIHVNNADHFKDVLNKHERYLWAKDYQTRENRRCTMYLIVTGVLFAMLFMYIDRLQQQSEW